MKQFLQRIFQEIMKKKITLGTSDTWLTSHLSHRIRKQTYYIVDCRIFGIMTSRKYEGKEVFRHFFGGASYRKFTNTSDNKKSTDTQTMFTLFFYKATDFSFDSFRYCYDFFLPILIEPINIVESELAQSMIK